MLMIPGELISPAIGQILETMYFCEMEFRGPGVLPEPVIGAAVVFHGTCSGEMRLAVTDRFALRITADFLGAEMADITRPQMVSTVRELANVACGAALNAWMPAAGFRFAVPTDLLPPHLSGRFRYLFAEPGEQPKLAMEFSNLNLYGGLSWRLGDSA